VVVVLAELGGLIRWILVGVGLEQLHAVIFIGGGLTMLWTLGDAKSAIVTAWLSVGEIGAKLRPHENPSDSKEVDEACPITKS
jgi:hypothetical protein